MIFQDNSVLRVCVFPQSSASTMFTCAVNGGLQCHELPVRECFGRDPSWRFSCATRKQLQQHEKCHNKFLTQALL